MPVKAQITGEVRLKSLVNALNGFDSAVRLFTKQILNNEGYKNILIAYNIENLQKGIRSDGTDIEKTPTGRQKSTRYEEHTRKIKERRGDLTDYVTLHDTGSFYRDFDIAIGYDRIYLLNRNIKAEILSQTWGERIIGISDEQIEEFCELIRPEYEKFLKRYFNEKS